MPDDLGDSLIAGAMVGGGESREHIEYNVQTQVVVPLLQDIMLVATVLVVIACLFPLGAGLLDVARMCQTAIDLALCACFITIGLTVVVGLTLTVARKVARVTAWTPPWWFPAVAFLLGFVWVMALLNLIRLADGNWTIWDTVRFVLPLALIIGVPFLTYRSFRELLNPKYPPSPTTDVLLELIRRKFATEEPEQVMVRRPIPYRVGNSATNLHVEEPAEPEPQAAAATLLDDDFVDLLALVERAALHGWTRDRHVGQRLRMPSGRLLTRGLYDSLVDLAADPWRIIAKSGIPGQSPEWLTRPDAAIHLLRTIYELQFGEDGEVLPIEDPDLPRQAGRQPGRQAPGE